MLSVGLFQSQRQLLLCTSRLEGSQRSDTDGLAALWLFTSCITPNFLFCHSKSITAHVQVGASDVKVASLKNHKENKAAFFFYSFFVFHVAQFE